LSVYVYHFLSDKVKQCQCRAHDAPAGGHLWSRNHLLLILESLPIHMLKKQERRCLFFSLPCSLHALFSCSLIWVSVFEIHRCQQTEFMAHDWIQKIWPIVFVKAIFDYVTVIASAIAHTWGLNCMNWHIFGVHLFMHPNCPESSLWNLGSSKAFQLFIWFCVIVLSHPFNIRLSLWFRKDTLHKKSCMSGLSNFYSESVKKLHSSYLSKSHGTHQRSCPSLYICLNSSLCRCLTLVYFCMFID